MDKELPEKIANTSCIEMTSSKEDQPFTTLESLFGWSDVMHEAMTSFQAFGTDNSSADSTAQGSQELLQQQDTPCSASFAEPKQQNTHVTSPVLYRGKVYYADQKPLHRLSRVSTEAQPEYSVAPPPPEYNVPPPPPPPPPARAPRDSAQVAYQDAATGQQPRQPWRTSSMPIELTNMKVPPASPGTSQAAGLSSTVFLQASQTTQAPSCSTTASMAAAAFLQAAQVPPPTGAPLVGTMADTVFLQARVPAPPPMPPPGSSMTGPGMPAASSSMQAAQTLPPQGSHLQQCMQQDLASVLGNEGYSSASVASAPQQRLSNLADQAAQQQEIYHWQTLAEREAKLVNDKEEHKAYAAWLVEQKCQQAMVGLQLQQRASQLASMEEKLKATAAQQDEVHADLALRLEKLKSDMEALEAQRLKVQQDTEELEQQVRVLDLAKTMKLLLASPGARAAAAAANKSGCQHCLERLINPAHMQRQAEQLLAACHEQQFVSTSHTQAAPRKQPSSSSSASLADVLKERLQHSRIKESQQEEKQQQLEQQDSRVSSAVAAIELESMTTAGRIAPVAATSKPSIANPTMNLRLTSSMVAKAKDAAVSHAAVQAVLARKLKPKASAGAADSKVTIGWQLRAAQQALEASAAAAAMPTSFAAAVTGKTQASKPAQPAGIKVLYHRHSSSK